MRTVAPGDELRVSRVQVKPSRYQGKAASLGAPVAERTASRARLSVTRVGRVRGCLHGMQTVLRVWAGGLVA